MKAISTDSNSDRRAGYYAVPVTIALVVRVLGIGVLPPFVDESGNILASVSNHYAQSIDCFAQGRPLLELLFRTALLSRVIFGADGLLLWARAQTAASGVLSTLLIQRLVCLLFGSRAGLVAGVLWAICPLILLHDRLALQDPYTSVFFLIALTFWSRARASDEPSIIWAMASGAAVGLAVLNKITSILALPWVIGIALFPLLRVQARVWVAGVAGLVLTLLPVLAHLQGFGADLYTLGHAPQFLETQSHLIRTIFAAIRQLNEGMFSIERIQASYNSIGYFFLLVGSWMISMRLRPELAYLRAGLAANIIISALAYSHIAHGRYVHPDMIPQILLIASAYLPLNGLGLIERLVQQGWRILLGVTLGVWILGIYSVLRDPVANSFREARDASPSDYEQYTVSYASGNGIEKAYEAFENILGKTARPTYLFVSAGHFTSGRSFALRYLNDPRVVLVDICFADVAAPAVIHSIMSEASEVDPLSQFWMIGEAVTGIDGTDLTRALTSRGAISLEDETSISRDLYRYQGMFTLARISNSDSLIAQSALSQEALTWGASSDAPRTEWLLNSVGESTGIEFRVIPSFALGRGATLNVSIDGTLIQSVPLRSLPETVAIQLPSLITAGKHRVQIISSQWRVAPNGHMTSCGYRSGYSFLGPRIQDVKFTQGVARVVLDGDAGKQATAEEH